MEQRERRERNLSMPPPLIRLPHRMVVRERHKGYPGRCHPPLHRERRRRDTLPLYGSAYQPHGPVTQRSRGREQHGVHPVLGELSRHLRGSTLD